MTASGTAESGLDLGIQTTLATAIRATDPDVRQAAAQALSGSPLHTATQTTLASALRDTNPEVRASAARALGR